MWGNGNAVKYFVILALAQNGKLESSSPWTSGTPPPCLFSILIKSVVGGAFALIDFQKFASGPWLIGCDVLHRGGLDLERLRILLLQRSQPGRDLIARHLVERVDCFAAVDCQAAHRRPDLFGVDRSGELTRIFRALRQLCQPFKLADCGHPVAALAFLAQFGDALDDMGKVLPVQKLAAYSLAVSEAKPARRAHSAFE
jgi:hypothetical protein